MPGRFISIEGGDGAGKSTQLTTIAEILGAHDIEFVMTREPGGTPLGEALRELLLNQGKQILAKDTELMLMFAARAQHVEAVIKPALAQGIWVVSDRFSDASFAYQGAQGLPLERIQALSDWVLQGFLPDLTLLFDLSVEQGFARVNQRGEQQDRFEKEPLAYKQRVRQIYRSRAEAEPGRISIIDARGDIESVSQQVKQQLNAFIEAMPA